MYLVYLNPPFKPPFNKGGWVIGLTNPALKSVVTSNLKGGPPFLIKLTLKKKTIFCTLTYNLPVIIESYLFSEGLKIQDQSSVGDFNPYSTDRSWLQPKNIATTVIISRLQPVKDCNPMGVVLGKE